MKHYLMTAVAIVFLGAGLAACGKQPQHATAPTQTAPNPACCGYVHLDAIELRWQREENEQSRAVWQACGSWDRLNTAEQMPLAIARGVNWEKPPQIHVLEARINVARRDNDEHTHDTCQRSVTDYQLGDLERYGERMEGFDI